MTQLTSELSAHLTLEGPGGTIRITISKGQLLKLIDILMDDIQQRMDDIQSTLEDASDNLAGIRQQAEDLEGRG